MQAKGTENGEKMIRAWPQLYLVWQRWVLLSACAAGLLFVPFTPEFSRVAIPSLAIANAMAFFVLRRSFESKLVLATGSASGLILLSWFSSRDLGLSLSLLSLLFLAQAIIFVLETASPPVQKAVVVQQFAVWFVLHMAIYVQALGGTFPDTDSDMHANSCRMLYLPALALPVVWPESGLTIRADRRWGLVFIAFGVLGNGISDFGVFTRRMWPDVLAAIFWLIFIVGLILLAVQWVRTDDKNPRRRYTQ